MFNNDWDYVLKDYINSEKFINLINKVDILYKSDTCYPAYSDIFRALKITSFNNTHVVIIGQDPYHGENEAHGLSFSVRNGVKMPPSLRNIFKELKSDLDITRTNTDLTDWANEGVLLLNSVLSVKKDHAYSHSKIGWQDFTEDIIKKINDKDTPVVFILWGNYAIEYEKMITNSKHLVIKSAHPSPLSAYHGFFGSKPFSRTNEFLKANNLPEIKW